MAVYYTAYITGNALQSSTYYVIRGRQTIAYPRFYKYGLCSFESSIEKLSVFYRFPRSKIYKRVIFGGGIDKTSHMFRLGNSLTPSKTADGIVSICKCKPYFFGRIICGVGIVVVPQSPKLMRDVRFVYLVPFWDISSVGRANGC